MADNDTQIKTKFLLEGVAKALGELRTFVRGVQASAAESTRATAKTADGMKSIGRAAVKSGAETLTTFKVLGREIQVTGRTAVVAGVAVSAATKTIGASFAGVLALFRALRSSIERTYAIMIGGAGAAALAVRAAFASVPNSLKFSLNPLSANGLIGQFASLAARSASTFSNVFSKGLGGITGTIGTVLSAIKKSILPLVVVGVVGAVTAAVAAAVVSVVPILGAVGAVLGDMKVKKQVDNTAETTGPAGFDIKKSTQLQSFFEQIGEKAEDATSIMAKFGAASKEIAENGADSDLAKSLSAAGIAFQDLNGRARSGAAIFQDLTDAFRNGTVDPAQYEAVADAMSRIVGTGKDSTAFYRLLNELSGDAGSSRLSELTAQAEKFGTVIGPQQIASMHAFETGLGMLKQAYSGLTIALSTSIGPQLGAFFDGFATLIATNKDSIVKYATEAVNAALVLIIETGVVLTQGKKAFENYQFRFPWLVTLREAAIKTWEVLKAVWGGIKDFYGFVVGMGPLAGAVLGKVMDQLGLTVGDIGSAVGAAAAWVRNFVGSMAELYVYGTVRPGFEWLFTVKEGLKIAAEVAGWLWDGLKRVFLVGRELINSDFGQSIKTGLVDAFNAALALGRALADFAKTGNVAPGFEWIQTVADGFNGLISLGDRAIQTVQNVYAALAGDKSATASDPIAKKIVDTIQQYLPMLENVYKFASNLLPPLLAFVGDTLNALEPYLARFKAYLASTSDYVVNIIRTIAQYFAGEDLKTIEGRFKWVYGLLDAVRDIAKTISGIARVGAGQILDPKGFQIAKGDEDFAWVQRVVQSFQLLRDAIVAVGNTLSGLTGGALGPVAATFALVFGIKAVGAVDKLLGSLGGLKSKLGDIVPLLARMGGGAVPLIAGAAATAAGGPLVGLAATVLTAGLSKGFRAGLGGTFLTAAERKLVEDAAIGKAKEAAKIARETRAGLAFDSVTDILVDTAATRRGIGGVGGGGVGRGGPGGGGGYSPRDAFEKNKLDAASREARAASKLADGAAKAAPAAFVGREISDAARSKVASELAMDAPFFGGLRGAASVLARFAGAAGWAVFAYQMADLVAEVTGAKARLKKFFVGDPFVVRPGEEQAYADFKARGPNASTTPRIDDLKQTKTRSEEVYGPEDGDVETYKDGMPSRKILMDFIDMAHPERNSDPELLQRFNEKTYGDGRTRPEQQMEMNNPNNFYAQQFRAPINYADAMAAKPKDEEYNPAAVRADLNSTANAAAKLVDTLNKAPVPVLINGDIPALMSPAAIVRVIENERRKRASSSNGFDDVLPQGAN